jgi:hypothetical protein
MRLFIFTQEYQILSDINDMFDGAACAERKRSLRGVGGMSVWRIPMRLLGVAGQCDGIGYVDDGDAAPQERGNISFVATIGIAIATLPQCGILARAGALAIGYD